MIIKDYRIIDVQEMPKDIKEACFIFFNECPNNSYQQPHVDGYEDIDGGIEPAIFGGGKVYESSHAKIIKFLFKELQLSFEDVKAWDNILIKYWW